MPASLKPIALFRADGGRVWSVSIGHLKRCLLISQGLARSYRCIFLMKDYPDGVDYVRSHGVEVETLPPGLSAEESHLIGFLERYRPKILFVDLLESRYAAAYEIARAQGITTAVLDTLGKYTGSPDFVVNDSIVESFRAYGAAGAHTRFLVGPDYFILPKAPVVPPVAADVHHILVTMGGADPAGLTVKVVDGLKPALLGLKCTIVLGPAFSADAEVRRRVSGTEAFAVLKSPDDFLSLLAVQDVVISAAGRTLSECAYLGRPVIMVPSIEHEEATAAAFQDRAGYLNTGKWVDHESPMILQLLLDRYRKDAALRHRVHARGRCLFKGNGLTNLLNALGVAE